MGTILGRTIAGHTCNTHTHTPSATREGSHRRPSQDVECKPPVHGAVRECAARLDVHGPLESLLVRLDGPADLPEYLGIRVERAVVEPHCANGAGTDISNVAAHDGALGHRQLARPSGVDETRPDIGHDPIGNRICVQNVVLCRARKLALLHLDFGHDRIAERSVDADLGMQVAAAHTQPDEGPHLAVAEHDALGVPLDESAASVKGASLFRDGFRGWHA